MRCVKYDYDWSFVSIGICLFNASHLKVGPIVFFIERIYKCVVCPIHTYDLIDW